MAQTELLSGTTPPVVGCLALPQGASRNAAASTTRVHGGGRAPCSFEQDLPRHPGREGR